MLCRLLACLVFRVLYMHALCLASCLLSLVYATLHFIVSCNILSPCRQQPPPRPPPEKRKRWTCRGTLRAGGGSRRRSRQKRSTCRYRLTTSFTTSFTTIFTTRWLTTSLGLQKRNTCRYWFWDFCNMQYVAKSISPMSECWATHILHVDFLRYMSQIRSTAHTHCRTQRFRTLPFSQQEEIKALTVFACFARPFQSLFLSLCASAYNQSHLDTGTPKKRWVTVFTRPSQEKKGPLDNTRSRYWYSYASIKISILIPLSPPTLTAPRVTSIRWFVGKHAHCDVLHFVLAFADDSKWRTRLDCKSRRRFCNVNEWSGLRCDGLGPS